MRWLGFRNVAVGPKSVATDSSGWTTEICPCVAPASARPPTSTEPACPEIVPAASNSTVSGSEIAVFP